MGRMCIPSCFIVAIFALLKMISFTSHPELVIMLCSIHTAPHAKSPAVTFDSYYVRQSE
jgi:hypothetical protein